MQAIAAVARSVASSDVHHALATLVQGITAPGLFSALDSASHAGIASVGMFTTG
jgi:hypothetical protein